MMNPKTDALVRKKFSAYLRKYRTERGLSQSQLAELSGSDQRVISRYETGRRVPVVADMILLASALGVTLDALIPPETYKGRCF